MTRIMPVIILCFAFLLNNCGLNERKEAIEQNEAALQQKEQRLLLLEKNLKLKEDSLNLILARRGNSSYTDSISLLPPALWGAWSVKMVCIQTTCSSSAIGDVRTDSWQITGQDSAVIIKTVTHDNVTRIYTGNYYQDNTIRVSDRTHETAVSNVPVRIVEIVDIRNNKMKGTRVLIQQDGCHVTYSLEMDKKQ